MKKGVLINLEVFTAKHLCGVSFHKVARQRDTYFGEHMQAAGSVYLFTRGKFFY